MSSPRYKWWGYVKAMCKDYRKKGREGDEAEKKERKAVKIALEEIQGQVYGHEKKQLVEMVLIERTHTLHGAAGVLYVSYKTAQKWHADFLKLVAKNRGLM